MTKQYRYYGQLLLVATGTKKATERRTFKEYLNDALSKCRNCEVLEKHGNVSRACEACFNGNV